MSLTEQKIEERRNYVGGTDAGIIMGVNPYESLFDVWEFKLGLADGKDLSDIPRVEAGNFLEPVVAELFTKKTGIELQVPEETVIHPEYNWMAGNIDRLTEDGTFLEIKTASSDVGWDPQGFNRIPKHYLCQTCHYGAIKKVSYWYCAVLINGWDFRFYKIERSLKFEEKLIERERDFWINNVLAKSPPPPRNYDDVVSLYRNKTIENPITSNENMEKLIEEISRIKKSSKLLKESEGDIKNKLALYMKANESLMSTTGELLATFKYAKDSEKFDSKRFQKEHPELYNQYLINQKGSRRFLLKGDRNEE